MQFLQPVFGIAASAVLFGDRMGPLFLAGLGLAARAPLAPRARLPC